MEGFLSSSRRYSKATAGASLAPGWLANRRAGAAMAGLSLDRELGMELVDNAGERQVKQNENNSCLLQKVDRIEKSRVCSLMMR
jgi:hypothetical protein